MAGLIDETAMYLINGVERDIIMMNYLQEEEILVEKDIKAMDAKTGGSLKFKVLNPSGSVWTLVAGGGASVVYTDAIVSRG